MHPFLCEWVLNEHSFRKSVLIVLVSIEMCIKCTLSQRYGKILLNVSSPGKLEMNIPFSSNMRTESTLSRINVHGMNSFPKCTREAVNVPFPSGMSTECNFPRKSGTNCTFPRETGSEWNFSSEMGTNCTFSWETCIDCTFLRETGTECTILQWW